MALLSHRFCCAFGMVGVTVRFVGAGIPPMSDRQVHTHNMYTNTNYCITFMFAYSTHYALIRMKHKYFQCIQQILVYIYNN